jgi:hypothetical protein
VHGQGESDLLARRPQWKGQEQVEKKEEGFHRNGKCSISRWPFSPARLQGTEKKKIPLAGKLALGVILAACASPVRGEPWDWRFRHVVPATRQSFSGHDVEQSPAHT